MKKCDLCDAEATVHVAEVAVSDDGEQITKRHLCEECAQRFYEENPRDSGSAAPPEDETPEEIVARAKQVGELMRNQNYRQSASQMYDALLRLQDQSQSFDIQSPLYKRLRELHVPFGSAKQFPQSREEWIDLYVQRMNQYWDRFEAFVEKHQRRPTDEEMNDLLEE
jgi:hypothetical protein